MKSVFRIVFSRPIQYNFDEEKWNDCGFNITELGAVIETTTRVKHLSLRCSYGGAELVRCEEIQHCLKALNKNKTIKSVQILWRTDNFDKEQMNQFIDLVTKNTFLKRFVIDYRLPKENIAAICNWAIRVKLVKLDIYYCVLNDESLLHVENLLSHCPSLRDISIGQPCFSTISSSLRFQNVLRKNYTILSGRIGTVNDVNDCLKSVCRRNQNLIWKTVHKTILEASISLISLDIPRYIVLWFVESLPGYKEAHLEYKKVNLITATFDSAKKIKENRTFYY